MISLLIYAQAADLFSFLVALPHIGISGEANPVIRFLVDNLGIQSLIASKLIALLFTIFYMRRMRPPRRHHNFIGAFGITLGTAGLVTNMLSLAIVA